MTRRLIARWIAFIAGCIAIAFGLRHFPLAFEMAQYPEFAKLSESASDLLILLWFCVGLQIIAFGVLSVYFSKKLLLGAQYARFFFLFQGIVVLFRIAFELMYPVSVPEPSPAVLVRLVVLCLLLLIPVGLTAGQSQTRTLESAG